MRWLGAITVFAGFLSIGIGEAQSLAEHGAAAAGATIGTAAGKPLSGAITKIFGDVDDQAKTAAKPVSKPATAATSEKPPAGSSKSPAAAAGAVPAGADGGSGSGAAGGSTGTSKTDELVGSTLARRRSTAKPRHTFSSLQNSVPAPLAPPPVVEPPAPKVLTAEEVANIKLGASEKDVLATLGVPASRVIIPDDDGHLRESYQYWANGSQVGTVRLDNGYVVKVEARP